MAAKLTNLPPPGETISNVWREYEVGFHDWLEETNRAPLTRRTYLLAVRQLGEFLLGRGMPTDPTVVTREHLGEWMRHLLRAEDDGGQGVADQTALQRFRSASRFFQWLVDEDEIQASPMEKMTPPRVPEKPVPVLADNELIALFKATEGTTYEARRDRAIIGIFIDCGLRIGELAGLTLADVNLEERELRVMGKGRRARYVPVHARTRADIQRYLRQRAKHPHHDEASLWLGRQGGMTNSAIYRVVVNRAEKAGIGPIHPHQLRHSFAHLYLRAGGSEGNLMRVTGWKSRSMVDRYGASVADERAKEAHDAFSPRNIL